MSSLIAPVPDPVHIDKVPSAVFKVDPSMKKPEIKEYLESIYGLNVLSVHTMNYDGSRTPLPNQVLR